MQTFAAGRRIGDGPYSNLALHAPRGVVEDALLAEVGSKSVAGLVGFLVVLQGKADEQYMQ